MNVNKTSSKENVPEHLPLSVRAGSSSNGDSKQGRCHLDSGQRRASLLHRTGTHSVDHLLVSGPIGTP